MYIQKAEIKNIKSIEKFEIESKKQLDKTLKNLSLES
jgi:hypothetical protein